MADATGATTTNYSFKTIAGTDVAGYTSINSVVTSIDTQLQDKAFTSGMVIFYQGAAPPSGWTNFTSSMTSSGVTLPSGYIWIKKA